MTDHRGLSLVELLVAAMVGTLVVGGLLSFYLATTRSFGESAAQAALQRQGSLALDEIARQVRSAVGPNAISTVTCNGVAGAIQVSTPSGNVCYYATAAGALCEYRGNGCRDLLAGGLKSIVLVTQTTPPDPRCPPVVVVADAPCFAMTPTPNSLSSSSQVDVAFAIRDNDGGLDGVNAMSFAISLTCIGRNCS